MIITKVGDWAKVLDVFGKVPSQLAIATKKATLKEAHFLRTKMVDGIKEQAPGGKAFLPLAPSTIAVRRLKGFNGTKALIHRGDLRNSIAVVQSGEGIFIGVHRTAKSKDGKDLVDVAVVQEFGSGPIVIQMTPKMRRLLAAAFRQARTPFVHASPGSGTGIIVTKIPPRPFVGPVFEKYGGAASRDRIEAELSRLLVGSLS